MSKKIFVCSEVIVDLLERPSKPGMLETSFGGSGFFTALGAQKVVASEGLNIAVNFVGPLSKDNFGWHFFDSLTKAGINTDCVTRVDRNSTLAIVALHPGKENSFAFYSRGSAEEMVQRDELPQKLSGNQNICCFGSISSVIEPARHAWLQFAREQKGHSLVYYDLNTRPQIAKDAERYRGIVAEWAQTAHVIKSSDADIAWAYPGKSTRQVADLWLQAGAAMVVFTKGGEGSEAFTVDGKTVSAASPRLKVTSTVGAGDNNNAGLAVALAKRNCFTPTSILRLEEGQLSQVLSEANQASARHLIALGARPIPRPPARRARPAQAPGQPTR